MARRTPSRQPQPARQPSRILGYGAGKRPRTAPERGSPRSAPWVAVAAWLATTALAGALLLLLARHDVFLALPVVLGYALVSWLLWSTRLRLRGRAQRRK